MITNVYFVRHAESDYSVHEDKVRPLTKKGQLDTIKIIDYFKDKDINVIASSPYKRAIDTIKPFADVKGIKIKLIDNFRERKISSGWIEDFNKFSRMQWEDFTYKLTDGECLRDVQKRNISALEEIIDCNKGKNIVVGSHGTALCTVINHFDSTYGYDDFESIKNVMPWIIKLVFEENSLVSMQNVSL